MDFVTATRTCINKFADFNGRAPRSEYWWFYLAVFIAIIAASIVDAIIGMIIGFSFIAALVGLAAIIPLLAAGVRRLHDINKSGWWLLIGLVPFVGGLILLYFFVQKGTAGPNQFGADPLPQEMLAA